MRSMSAEEDDSSLALDPVPSMAISAQQAPEPPSPCLHPQNSREATTAEASLEREMHMNTMDTKLCRFVMEGKCQALQELVRSNVEIVRRVAPQGDSALHIAAVLGHHEIVELLVTQMPCMLLMRNSKQETALHSAARSGNCKVVEVLLLKVQNRLQCSCNSSSCPLNTDPEAPRIEVDEIWRAQNTMGETALHFAVRGNFLEVVEQLLHKQIGIESIVNNVGESPLFTACCYGCLEIGERLLGLDPVTIGDTRNDRTNCLHQAIISFLEGRDEQYHYLRKWHGFAVKLAIELVRKRPQLAEAVDPSGNSPLHLLVALPNLEYKHIRLAEELLEASPNMNFKLNNDDMAPIHIAARDGNPYLIEILLDRVPHCSYMLNKKKKNALHFALKHHDDYLLLQNVESLLEYSVDKGFLVNEPDSKGKTALSMANETLVEPLKYLILDKMLGTSPPGPHIFRKSQASKSIQLDFKKEVAANEAKRGQPKENVEGKDPKERLSVIAALIATISFAAAFTIPGGFNEDNGNLVLMHEAALKTFIFFDSLALSLSIMSLLQLIYRPTAGLTGVYKLLYRAPANIRRIAPKNFEQLFARWWRDHARKNFEQELRLWGRRYLFWSLNATMVAFASGVYVVVAPKCQWLAMTVCIITLGSLLLESIMAPILRITLNPILRILLKPIIWLVFTVPGIPFYCVRGMVRFNLNLYDRENESLRSFLQRNHERKRRWYASRII